MLGENGIPKPVRHAPKDERNAAHDENASSKGHAGVSRRNSVPSCIEMAGMADDANPHGEKREDNKQSTNIREASRDQAVAQFEEDADRQHQRAHEKNCGPAPPPDFAENYVRLKESEHHGEQTEFDGVRMGGNFDSFVSLELAVVIERAVDSFGVVRCRGGCDLGEI